MSQYQRGGESAPQPEPQLVTVGRYVLHREIARGGMATIHIARLMGDEGFSRIVAAKRLLPEFAEDPEFVAMFLDEARIASRIHHRNVVPVLDVVTTGCEAILVQEYVRGVPLYWLLRAAQRNRTRIPLDIAVSIGCQVLAGLHAAHETLDEMGMPLDVVHRDVSPQNVMVAVDGSARLLDFGIAKARLTAHITRAGQFKGKLAYAAPEQLYGHAARQSDLYSLSALLWELIVGHGMHHDVQADAELIAIVMNGTLPTITAALAPERDAIGPERWRQLAALEPILEIGLSITLTDRWATAADMERALAEVVRPASPSEVAAWLKSLAREFIDKHERVLAAEEASWRRLGITVPHRLTPVPRELAREPSTPVPAPVPVMSRWQASSRTWIAALCGLGAALGIVLALRASSADSATAAPAIPSPPSPASASPESSSPAAAEPPRTAPSVPAAVLPTAGAIVEIEEPAPPLPTVAPLAPFASEGVAPRPEVEAEAEAEVEVEVDVIDTPPIREPVKPARVRVPVPPKKVPPPAEPAVAAPPRPPAVPAVDCDPPYYYDGPKKIFKPACI